ncbi:hypothetical protein [uncultured Aquabacterium sp.]|uniref:hypothetical protein n=1 Tax=uncultured Aquabacterium sp. TaxID=158753 RepID=UPI00262C52F0|nr:hypothetical protein [uncultured Aquabacterium sp.]
MATLYAVLGYIAFGDKVAYIIFLKVLLVVAALAWIAWLVFRSRGEKSILDFLALLLISTSSYTVANIVNIQVEEGFGFVGLAVCWAVLLYGASPERKGHLGGRGYHKHSIAILFGCSAAIALLSKSSFVLCVAVLLVAFGYKFGLRYFLACLLVVATSGVAWASYQYAGSGRFTIGTSLDGWNLYKGNNPYFLERYPPTPGTSLDMYDDDLFKDSPAGGEWVVNDFYREKSFAYILNNKEKAVAALKKKFWVCFFSVEKYGSTSSEGVRKYYELGSMILFRVVFWLSLGAAVADSFVRRQRALGIAYILFVGGLLLPYLVGFAYTRHVSVLALPAVLYLLAFIRRNTVAPLEAPN